MARIGIIGDYDPGLVVSGTDEDGGTRILELPELRFFVATLFVPQARSAPGAPHPLVEALVTAAAGQPAAAGRPAAGTRPAPATR
jgi:CTP synthase (UTP-ammonia lyase)